MDKESSGINKLTSISFWYPNPSQVGQLPNGVLNEKFLGFNSSKLIYLGTSMSQLLQATNRRVEFERIPYLDHRFDEILEIVKRFLEFEWTFVPFVYDWWNFTINPNDEVALFEIHGEGVLEQVVARVKMPNDTPPDIGPKLNFVDFMGVERELHENTIYELGKILNLKNVPNPEGYVTLYDEANHIYVAVWPRKVPFRSLKFAIRNWSSVKCVVEALYVYAKVRPYVRYTLLRKTG